MFEVSVRTIYRDIESINGAGIPIVTYQGANGGIGIMEGYRLDRNVLTDRELADIFTALQGVSSIGGNAHTLLMEKISSVIPPSQSAAFRSKTTQLIIDSSPWGIQRILEDKLTILKEALEDSVIVAFEYVNAQGQTSKRAVKPYTLVLKGQTWYLYGFCQHRQDFRLFKLLRMKALVQLNQTFIRKEELDTREMPWSTDYQRVTSAVTPILLRFTAEGKHLAEDRFDAAELEPDPNGGYKVTLYYPEDGWLYGFLLSFGMSVEVLEPEHIRQKLGELAAGIAAKY